AAPLLGLGELYLARRRPEQAVPLLERALGLEPSEYTASVQLTLAEALWPGDKDKKRARTPAQEVQASYERLRPRPGIRQGARRALAARAPGGHRRGGAARERALADPWPPVFMDPPSPSRRFESELQTALAVDPIRDHDARLLARQGLRRLRGVLRCAGRGG